jgi:hypothetical protein
MLAAAGIVLGLGALVVVILAVTRSGRFAENSPMRATDAEFNVGDAAARAEAIDRDRTPLLFQDPADFERPVWVNHLGDDPDSGWVAFAAAIDRCDVAWQVDAQEFRDCSGMRYAPDGTGLTQYEVRVEHGDVLVDLTPDEEATTTTIPESG